MVESLAPTQVQPPPVDPSLLADPLKQQKMAANVLSQLGLHPDQQGAKSLLDAHFAGPTAHPEVTDAVKNANITPLVGDVPAGIPEVKNPGMLATEPPPDDQTPTTPTAPAAPAAPAAPTQSSGAPDKVSIKTATSMPAPGVPGTVPNLGPADQDKLNLINTGSDQRVLQSQQELNRLIDTGSGIHQIKNPFLRGLATTANVAGDIFLPHVMGAVPGTEEHHAQLINNAENQVKEGIKQRGDVAKIQQEEELANKAATTTTELEEWIKQNPGHPMSEYWDQKRTAGMTKLTPQEQTMFYLTTPVEQGGAGQTPEQAFKTIQSDIQGVKPKTTAQIEARFQALVGKTMPNGVMDPKTMSDAPTLVKTISDSPNLTDDEKSEAFAYLVSKTTPASSAYAPNAREKGMGMLRLFPAINTETNQLAFVTPEMHAANPTKYIPAAQGTTSESKEAQFQDIDFNMKNVNSAIKNLKNGFDAGDRASLIIALSSPHPREMVTQFFKGEAGTSLTPDQIDYVTALAALQENVLALRTIQGLGTGSDDLRAAITKMIPGTGTPTRPYALRQMELFKGLVDRAHAGFPKSGVKTPPGAPAKTTQQLTDEDTQGAGGGNTSKNFTRQQVQDQVDNYNKNNQGVKGFKPMTLEDGIKDARQAGHTVDGK